MEDVGLGRERPRKRVELKSQRHASQRMPMEGGPNGKGEDLTHYVANRTLDAFAARRAGKRRAQQRLAKKGREIRRIPAERNDSFESYGGTECEHLAAIHYKLDYCARTS